MKIFITLVLVSMGLTFFVITNAAPVPLHFFTFSKEVPLPFILVFPTGTVLILFSLFHIRQMSKVGSVIRGLEDDIESEQMKVLEIIKRTHELDLANRKMEIRLGTNTSDFDEDSL